MVVVHHLNNSRSQRILWMLEELGIDYRIEHYARDKKTMLAPDSLKKIHPLGKSPVITDGDITVAETGAIIEYLASTYGSNMVPAAGSAEHRDYTYWMHYAEGSLMPYLVMTLVCDKIKTSPMPFFIRPIAKRIADGIMDGFVTPNLSNHLAFLEAHLAEREWFVGDSISGADVQMIFPLEAATQRGKQMSQYPNISAYVKRIHALATYQSGLQKGGPYDYA